MRGYSTLIRHQGCLLAANSWFTAQAGALKLALILSHDLVAEYKARDNF